jgi:Xaa-Pro dipeptidase
MIKKRLKRLFSETDVDCILILNTRHIDPSFKYFSALTSGVFEGSALIIKKKGIKLVTGELEYQTAKSQLKKGVILAKTKDQFWRKVNRELYGKVGLNHSFLSVKVFRKVRKKLKYKTKDVSQILQNIRMIKDKQEIKDISKAAKIVSKVADKIPDFSFISKTELEIKAEIDYLCTKFGSSKIPFSQVAFGKNSAFPHHTSGKTKLKKGDFILTDFGATVNNYNSDITRTFIYKKATPQKKKIYETVLQAQKLAIDSIQPGENSSNIHKIAENYINKSGFKGRFVHALGHMIGLQVHEGKALSKRDEFELEEGMVFTVEPGIYIPKLGGVRIEDDLVVTKRGCKLLTNTARTLRIIG